MYGSEPLEVFFFLRPNGSASYSVVLLLQGSSSLNSKRAAYLSFALEGDSMIAEMSTPSLHQAPSYYIAHGSIGASASKVGEVQYAIKSAKT